MKRLFLFFFALLMVGSIVFSISIQNASAAPKTIKLESIVGKDIKSITKTYRKQSRIDASEYSFKWYIFNRDSRRFMMVGVDNGQTVAVYCNSKYLNYSNVKIGTSRSAVRKKYGEPIVSATAGNFVYVFPNTDKKDIFLINGYYVSFYYDINNRYKVTSIKIVKQEYEDSILGKPVQLNDQTLAAYSRQSIDLVNSIRARFRRRKLSKYGKASKLSLSRSADMRDRNYFSHYSPEGQSPASLAKEKGIKFSQLCENIACGHKNAISAFEAFMNSSGHRKNILNKTVKKIGVGTAFGGDRSVYVTYTLMK